MLEYYHKSRINRRETNEDRYCCMKVTTDLVPDGIWCLIVSDGMGGASSGERYADLTVKETLHWLSDLLCDAQQTEPSASSSRQNPVEIIRDALPEAVNRINRLVIGQASSMKLHSGGATLAAAFILNRQMITCNVGDSPIYLIREGVTSELSVRDNRAEQMVREGTVVHGSEEYRRHDSELTAAIGISGSLAPHVSLTVLSDRDTVILGTDGAFGDLTSAEALGEVLQKVSPSQYVRKLLDTASAYTFDNQTVITAVYRNDTRRWPRFGR